MREKKYLCLVLVLCIVFSICGCGEAFPEMSEAEYNQTVEYAVGLLMRYSNNDQEKLIYLDAKELDKQRRKEAEKAAKEELKKEAESQSKPQVKQPTQTAQTTQPADNTPSEEMQYATLENLPSGTDSSAEEPVSAEIEATSEEIPQAEETSNPEEVVISSEYNQEIIDDIFLSYQGYSVSSSYPESSKSYVINAEKGKKLLVLRFDLYNRSESEKMVNVLEKGILYQIILNDKNLGYTAVTVLPNDLSTFIGTIESKSHESLVLLTEIDEETAKEISSLGMIVAFDGMEQTVILK